MPFDKICFLSVDVEHDYGFPTKEFKGVERLDEILSIFKKNSLSATLFVTGQALTLFPEKFKDLARTYEIASHSFVHRFWDTLTMEEMTKDLDLFLSAYKAILNNYPKGFRAPSHIIDEESFKLLEEKGFLYDSSVVPRYPFFKSYRGYRGRAPETPYYPDPQNIRQRYHRLVHGTRPRVLEIPVTGQLFGLPLSGVWIARVPFFVFKLLFKINSPSFITLNMHSWDIFDDPKRKVSGKVFLNNLERIINLLLEKGYSFLSGIEVYERFSEGRR